MEFSSVWKQQVKHRLRSTGILRGVCGFWMIIALGSRNFTIVPATPLVPTPLPQGEETLMLDALHTVSLHIWIHLTLNQPRTHKCVGSLHKSIRIYMAVIILGTNT